MYQQVLILSICISIALIFKLNYKFFNISLKQSKVILLLIITFMILLYFIFINYSIDGTEYFKIYSGFFQNDFLKASIFSAKFICIVYLLGYILMKFVLKSTNNPMKNVYNIYISAWKETIIFVIGVLNIFINKIKIFNTNTQNKKIIKKIFNFKSLILFTLNIIAINIPIIVIIFVYNDMVKLFDNVNYNDTLVTKNYLYTKLIEVKEYKIILYNIDILILLVLSLITIAVYIQTYKKRIYLSVLRYYR